MAVVIVNVEGDFFNQFAWIIYGGVILLLILVLLFGKEINGAKAWFRIGSLGIQPSEFSKMALGLVLARFITSTKTQFRSPENRIKAAGILLLPSGLILLQPDIGTLLVYTAFIFVMYREGLSGTILIAGMGAIVLGIITIIMSVTEIDYLFVGPESGSYLLYIIIFLLGAAAFFLVRAFSLPRYRKRRCIATFIWTVLALLFSGCMGFVMNSDKILKGYHKERIYNTMGIIEDNQGTGYNLMMSKTAVGSGGFSGKGYFNGPMTRYNFVPEQSTDFIFTSIGEEWGFLGSIVVLGLFLTLILRLLHLAERQRSKFSRVYGYTCASIIFMHVLINVGMVIGLAPVIGIPLPFISYGGSSLMGFTIMLFIMVRLDAERLTVFR